MSTLDSLDSLEPTSPRPRRVIVVGGGIAGVSCIETLVSLCPEVCIELISASPLVKVATNVRQAGLALDEFDVSEKPGSQLAAAHKNVTVTLDKVAEVDAEKKRVRLSEGRWRTYSELVVCTGARPQLIAGANEFVLGVRDTDTVAELRARLHEARRVLVVGNGGIATEFVYEVDNCQVCLFLRRRERYLCYECAMCVLHVCYVSAM